MKKIIDFEQYREEAEVAREFGYKLRDYLRIKRAMDGCLPDILDDAAPGKE